MKEAGVHDLYFLRLFGIIQLDEIWRVEDYESVENDDDNVPLHSAHALNLVDQLAMSL